MMTEAAIDWRWGPPLAMQRPQTVVELMQGCVEAFGDHPVLTDDGLRASWRDLDRWSSALAATLQHTLGFGDRLAILLGNGLPHLVCELACWRLGAIACPLPTVLGPSRLQEVLARLAPRVAILADGALQGCLPAGCLALSVERMWEMARTDARKERSVRAQDCCLIQFTSGSTGVPRGVMLSHGNLCSQQAAYAQLWPEVGVQDVLAAYLPWHHSFGALAERLWALARGVQVHLVPGGGRDRQLFCASMRSVRPTLFMSVPKMHALAAQERLFAPGQLRWAFTAGAPLPEALFAWYERLGVRVFEGWGLTESSPSAVITPPQEGRTPGVVGRPLPGVGVGVESGTGRILIQGPNVMLGYFLQDSPCVSLMGTARILDSGDLGAWSEQGLRLFGRSDHVYKLANGEKIHTPSIEAALEMTHIHHAVVAVEDAVLVILEARHGASDAQLLAAVAAANASLAEPWLRIQSVHVARQDWTIENGMLTVSMKVARAAVLESFRQDRLRQGGAYRCLQQGGGRGGAGGAGA
jgi:long-subunit acyl-CoA synthetase (AMP-forming)